MQVGISKDPGPLLPHNNKKKVRAIPPARTFLCPPVNHNIDPNWCEMNVPAKIGLNCGQLLVGESILDDVAKKL